MTYRELRAMIRQLSDCQVDRLGQMASRFLALKQELAETKPACCPVCGDENAAFIRKGFQNGKQRFQCKSCGHKFTYDTDRLTLIGDTLALRSLDSPLGSATRQPSTCATSCWYIWNRSWKTCLHSRR